MFDTVDPQTKLYLKKVMKTIFIGLFWMMANVVAGIFFELGFVDGTLSTANIIYFAISLITLVFLIRFFIKLWKGKIFTQR